MAAIPILASSLITKQDIGLYEGKARTRRRVGTGTPAIDSALGGGFVFGEDGVYNISGTAGSNVIETISLQLLITHLTTDDASTATLIDASGNFDVLRLYKSILVRLSGQGSNNHEGNVETATRLLDRVRIMRVFDYEGVCEGLNELIGELDARAVPKNTIADSQGEDGEVDLVAAEEQKGKQQRQKDKAGLVLINNLSQVLGLVLKNNYAQGQAMLTQLIRRLKHTASKHNLCVVLLSWSVTYKDDAEHVSVFEAIRSRPGLGKTLGYLVDTQILVDAIARQPHDSSDEVNVLEIVYTRASHGTGKFGLFEIDADGGIRAAVG